MRSSIQSLTLHKPVNDTARQLLEKTRPIVEALRNNKIFINLMLVIAGYGRQVCADTSGFVLS